MNLIRPLAVGTGLALLLTTATSPITPPAVAQAANRHEAAVRELIRASITPEYLEEVYAVAAQQAAVQFQASIQPTLGRELTVSENQRLYRFWDRKVREIMSYTALEKVLTPVYMRLFTLEEVEEINQFYRTPTGAKLIELLPTLTREATRAGEQLASGFVSDPAWMGQTLDELRFEFPDWFP
ncbi:MAG: DUF2059 domain-containing protein [Elainella sp.]